MAHNSAVLPLLEGHIVLLRRWQPVSQKSSLEIPRIAIGSGHTPAQAAVTAVGQNIGSDVDRLVELGLLHVDTRQNADSVYLFLASLAQTGAAAHSDLVKGNESAPVMPIVEFERMILANRITDAITISAFNFAKLRKLI